MMFYYKILLRERIPRNLKKIVNDDQIIFSLVKNKYKSTA